MNKTTRNTLIAFAGIAIAVSSCLIYQQSAHAKFNQVLEKRLNSFDVATGQETSYLYDSFSFNPFTQKVGVEQLQILVGNPQIMVVDIQQLDYNMDGQLNLKYLSAISTYGGAAKTIFASDNISAYYHEDGLGGMGATVDALYVTPSLYADYFSEQSLVLFQDIFANKALTVTASMKEFEKNKFVTSVNLNTNTGFDLNASVNYDVFEIDGVKGSSALPDSPISKDVLLNSFSFDITDNGFKDILINWGGNLGEPLPDQNEVFQAQLYDGLKSVFNEVWTAPSIPVDALNALNAFIRAGKGFEFKSEFKKPLSVDAVLEQFIGYPDVSIYENADVYFKVIENEKK
ncbi:hypothetical protein [Pseudoalteromonas marina]|uniref:DUF945 family protein n=1 Tax=Pseudoalteromonas marina TaxID=267375 RepID=A0ABT9FC02_9GAMM|nr:hypothetical protein [Pseudoalteromonas marina]MDP2564312.1 hypothetical protein [Pseudoalteromonas marina]